MKDLIKKNIVKEKFRCVGFRYDQPCMFEVKIKGTLCEYCQERQENARKYFKYGGNKICL